MTRARDTQRTKLYRAEDAAFPDGKTGGMELSEAIALIRQVWRSPWTRRHFYRARVYGPPRVTDGRGTRWARGGLTRINLPCWARTKSVILHELAHALDDSRDAAHGRTFARIFLQLVQHWLGVDAAKRLKDSFKAHGVKYKPKRTLTPETLERLRERGRLLAAARRAPSEGVQP